MFSQAFFSDLCWHQIITFFPWQLQSEHFLPHWIPNPTNLLRQKLILFLALHSLCAPKLSQTPVCFPSSVEWGWGITVQLTLDGWPASTAWFFKKPTRLTKSSTRSSVSCLRLAWVIICINFLNAVLQMLFCCRPTITSSVFVGVFHHHHLDIFLYNDKIQACTEYRVFTSCLLNHHILHFPQSTAVVSYNLWI